MVMYTRELEHSDVQAHLREATNKNTRVRVDLGNRVGYFALHWRTDVGHHVRPNNQNHAFVLTKCRVSYARNHSPTRFLYGGHFGPMLQDRSPSLKRATLTPRDPTWDATRMDATKANRRWQAKCVTEARKRLLPAAAVLETVACLREAQQWLSAVAVQAAAANAPAAQPLQHLAARIQVLIAGLPE